MIIPTVALLFLSLVMVSPVSGESGESQPALIVDMATYNQVMPACKQAHDAKVLSESDWQQALSLAQDFSQKYTAAARGLTDTLPADSAVIAFSQFATQKGVLKKPEAPTNLQLTK